MGENICSVLYVLTYLDIIGMMLSLITVNAIIPQAVSTIRVHNTNSIFPSCSLNKSSTLFNFFIICSFTYSLQSINNISAIAKMHPNESEPINPRTAIFGIHKSTNVTAADIIVPLIMPFIIPRVLNFSNDFM